MSRVIDTTTMTVDGLTDVGEWFLSGGPHDVLVRKTGDPLARTSGRAEIPEAAAS